MPSAPRPHTADPPAPGTGPAGSTLLAPAPLPQPLTPLVGREDVIRVVQTLLQDQDVRLLTLTGPGGVGKSRVAIDAADGLHARFEAGVHLVRLAAVRDADLVMPTVATQLGIPEQGRKSPLERVQTALRERSMLLILDNFEQVIAAAPLLADLLRACPGIKALVSSRQRLRLRGERLLDIEPLAVPGQGAADPDSVLESSAVRLFVQRAQDVSPDFVVTAGNAGAVAEIVRRLDGLPLAIELAAARSAFLPPAALVARLVRRLPVLTHGPRDLPDRLQAMRDAIAWSYDLLAPVEQDLFRHISVFAGGVTLDGAAAVGGDGQASPPKAHRADSPSVLDTLAALVEKSLVRPAPGPAEAAQTPRFAMLEVVREFGLERLAASGEEPAARQRHAAFYLALAEQAWPELIRWQNVHPWFDLFEAEHDNLRVALSWSLDHDPPVAVALAGALLWFWQDCGHRGEGRRWLRRALERAPESANMERARAVFASGLLAHWQDDDEEAIPAFEEAQARWQALGDSWGLRMTPLFLGVIRKDAGNFDEAIPYLEACLERCRADRDDALGSYALMHLAITRWGAGASQLAMRQLGEALVIHRRRADPIATNLALAYHILIAAEQDAAADATSLLAEGVDLCRSITAQEEIAFCLASGAVLATALNRPQHAARLFGAAGRLREEQGNPAKEPERSAYMRSAAQARADLGESTYQAAWDEGRRLTTGEALDVAAAAAQDAAPAPVVGPAGASGLTRREIEVLRLVAAGRTNAQLAEELFITPGTARIHVSNILGKLGASTRTEAAAIARERNLL